MLIQVRCNCGRPLGAYYKAFAAMRAKLVRADVAVTNVLPDLSINGCNVELGAVLDSLCMYKSCCRQKLITHIDFMSLY